MNKKIEQAKRYLQRARELARTSSSPFKGMTTEEAINKIRKVREKLWEEKLALRH